MNARRHLPALLLRADASPALGTGHLLRVLALADAWRARGGRSLVLSHRPDARFRERVLRHADAWLDLDARHPDAGDAKRVIEVAREEHAPLAVLDGYDFGPDYQRALRDGGLAVVCVDDNGHLPEYDADVLVNGNPYAAEIAYTTPRRTLRLLGCEHALLRPEFRAARERRRDARTRLGLLVTLGGADARNATARVLQGLAAARSLRDGRARIAVVVGAQNPHAPGLEPLVAALGSEARLLRDVADMAALLAEADLAISAAGTTSLELACLGVPALLAVVAENQQRIAASLNRLGVALALGELDSISPERVAAGVDALLGDAARRAEMARRGRELVDGLGAARVAEALERRLAARSAA